MKGPGQHCDMLRRQYKYLISPNGNRHGALIAPHIIWGAVSVADIPFDPSSISPLSSSFGPSQLLLFMQFILGHMSLSAPPPLRLPAFTPLCRCCHRPLADVSVSSPLLSPHWTCVSSVLCIVLRCPGRCCFPLWPGLKLNSCKGPHRHTNRCTHGTTGQCAAKKTTGALVLHVLHVSQTLNYAIKSIVRHD